MIVCDDLGVSDAGSLEARVEALLARVGELESSVAQRDRVIEQQADEIAELRRQVGSDSSNSSRPPSSDAPWEKQPAKKRSSRTRSGRGPGKQPGASSSSRALRGDPDEVREIAPDRCRACEASLAGAVEYDRQRRQVVDAPPPPEPTVTEYQRISRVCDCCGTVTRPG